MKTSSDESHESDVQAIIMSCKTQDDLLTSKIRKKRDEDGSPGTKRHGHND